MSRIGPYASLLIALILLLMAEVPRMVPGLLLMVGMSPERVASLASRVGVGIAIVAAGFIVLSLVWLLRIARIEAAWLPFRDAMVGVAAPAGQVVEVDYPRGMSFHVAVGGQDARVFVAPVPGGKLSITTALVPRQSFAVVRRAPVDGETLDQGPAGAWQVGGSGQSWELRSPRPASVEWISRDPEHSQRFDRFMGTWGFNLLLVSPGGVHVIAPIPSSERLGSTITRGLEALGTLIQLNPPVQPQKTGRSALW